jgi:multidrug transporter EmrE-like cation transporter
MMKGSTASPESAVLKARWRRWVKIVELFARERPACRRVDPGAYAILHKELVTSCRALAARASDVDAAFYRYIEDLVQPWLNPLVLGRADREILLDLLVRCRQAERAFIGRSWSLRLPLVVLLALFVSFFVFLWELDRGMTAGVASTVLSGLRNVSDDVWVAVTHSNEAQWLSFVAVMLVVVSIVSVSRTARS